mgnify:CR=1 FL=1
MNETQEDIQKIKDIKRINNTICRSYSYAMTASIIFVYVIYVYISVYSIQSKHYNFLKNNQRQALKLVHLCESTPVSTLYADCPKIQADASMNLNAHALFNSLKEHYSGWHFDICSAGSVCHHVMWGAVSTLVEWMVIMFFIFCAVAGFIAYHIYTSRQQQRMLQFMLKQANNPQNQMMIEMESYQPPTRFFPTPSSFSSSFLSNKQRKLTSSSSSSSSPSSSYLSVYTEEEKDDD